MQYKYSLQSSLGFITLASDGKALTGLWFDGQKYYGRTLDPKAQETETDIFRDTRRWLDVYFTGRDPGFTPPLRMDGSPFRRMVWEILLTIPYGETTTYGRIAAEAARRMGLAHMSAQAVGGAVGHNPISIIVPCHRVLGAGGSLTGYAGGLDRKSSLLRLERTGSADSFDSV